MREVLPWILLACTVLTGFLLLERRRRSRLDILDEWARKNGLALEREVGVAALAPLEPLTLVAPVVSVDRLWHGRVSIAPLNRFLEVFMMSCLVGTQHRPRRMLLGIFDAPTELPQLRVLPAQDVAAPQNLGFTPQPGPSLPPRYKLEAFGTVTPSIVQILGDALRGTAPDIEFRVELRPGRVLIATASHDEDDFDRVVALATELLLRLTSMPPEGEPDPEPRVRLKIIEGSQPN